MSEKAKNNARIGRIYYQSLTDSAGYPNGMEYWPEMSPSNKYYFTVTALDFIEKLAKEGYDISSPASSEFGLAPGSVYGEGDCKELMDEFESTAAEELAEFEETVRSMREAYARSKEDETDHRRP